MRVVIVGAGVIGLLSAYKLALSGVDVDLFDCSSFGSESSWAGGGIVSPLYPWRYASAVASLSAWSQDFYPAFAAELSLRSGVDPEVYKTGIFWIDLDDEHQAIAWGDRCGRNFQCVSTVELHKAVPVINKLYERALWLSDVANVRNPRLLKALQLTLSALPNVRMHEGVKVLSLLDSNLGLRVATSAGELLADRVLVAAGAWSGELLATLGLHLPVEPVKGQMILYKCEPDYLPAMVLAEGRYAIPRRDGHVLVGSTLEHVGFDKTPTGEALASLKASAEKMLPGLAQREVVGHWAGLRPGSPDGIPFIGEVPELPGLWLNCGHYRNGLVLAPASCELLKNLMLGETPIVDPAPYSPAGRLGAL